MKEVKSLIEKACQEKKARDKKRGILNRPLRAMVVGIPNVGKSTFINSFAGKPVPRPAISQVLQRENSGLRLIKMWNF